MKISLKSKATSVIQKNSNKKHFVDNQEFVRELSQRCDDIISIAKKHDVHNMLIKNKSSYFLVDPRGFEVNLSQSSIKSLLNVESLSEKSLRYSLTNNGNFGGLLTDTCMSGNEYIQVALQETYDINGKGNELPCARIVEQIIDDSRKDFQDKGNVRESYHHISTDGYAMVLSGDSDVIFCKAKYQPIIIKNELITGFEIVKRDTYSKLSKQSKLVRCMKSLGIELPVVSNSIAKKITMIADAHSRKSNFSGYTYREDMVSHAVETCLRYIDSFNAKDGDKPFSYFSQVCSYAFLDYWRRENEIEMAKHQYIANLGTVLDDLMLEAHDADEEFRNHVTSLLQSSNVRVKEDVKKPKRESILKIECVEGGCNLIDEEIL